MTKLLTHPSDGDLLAYLDGEMAELESQAARAHVETCEVCQQTLKVFRAGSAHVDDMLALVAVPEANTPKMSRPVTAPTLAIIRPLPQRRSWIARPSVRAALILFSVGAGTVAVSPLRAWVLDLFRWGETRSGASDYAEPNPQAANEPSSSSVSFVPTSRIFDVSLAARQSDGTLTIVFAEGTRAEGSVRGEHGPSLYVTQTGIAIANTSSVNASYRIVVPDSVRQVVVRIGEAVTERLDRDRANGEVVILLSTQSQ